MRRGRVRLLAACVVAGLIGVAGVACGPIGSSQAPELPVSGTLPPLLQPPTNTALPKGHIPNTADVQGCFPQTIIGTASAPKVVAYSAPSTKSPTVASFRQTNPQGSPQTFDLMQESIDKHGNRWVQALLPIRPNGTDGWIQESDLALSWTPSRWTWTPTRSP